MSLVSIRLDDKLLQEVKVRAHTMHLSQSNYIRRAIEHMNEEAKLQARKERLEQASLRVRDESMKINAEFSRIEHDPEA